MRKEVLRIERVTQVLGGVTTLNNFNLHIFGGEIMGLVCVDTNGKAELIDLLGQNLPIHYGTVYFCEREVNSYLHSPMTANSVALINNQSRLVGALSVADNIFVLRRGFKKYVIDTKTLDEQFARFAEPLGLGIRGDTLVADLSVFQKCALELLKAVVTGIKLVVIQDISSIISAADLKKFHRLMRRFAREGLSFLYVCNHHEESFTVSDRVALMQGGRVLRLMEKDNFSDEIVWHYSIDYYKNRKKSPARHKDPGAALRFDSVVTQNLKGLDFSVDSGECVVLQDVNNTTFGDIEALLRGRLAPNSGGVIVESRPLDAGRSRVSIIQQSPTKTMVYSELSYLENLCVLAAQKNRNFWLLPRYGKSVESEYLPLVGGDIYEQSVEGLSSASLYNLVYYRVHLFNPGVVVCVQPFFGADVYHRNLIIDLINKLRQKGIAVLLLAVNISDSLHLADRMLLIESGRLSAEYSAEQFRRLSDREGYPKSFPANEAGGE